MDNPNTNMFLLEQNKELKQIIKEEVNKIIIQIEDDPNDPKPTVGGIEGYYATKSWELRQASRRINKIKSALEDAKSAGDSAAVKELEKQLKVAMLITQHQNGQEEKEHLTKQKEVQLKNLDYII